MAPKFIDPDAFMPDEALWQFCTPNYRIVLFAEPEVIDPSDSFEFDDDIAFASDGEPAHWFCAVVAVYGPSGERIGWDTLGGCSYNSFREFYTSHRGNKGGYFPDMVRQALSEARATMLARQFVEG